MTRTFPIAALALTVGLGAGIAGSVKFYHPAPKIALLTYSEPATGQLSIETYKPSGEMRDGTQDFVLSDRIVQPLGLGPSPGPSTPRLIAASICTGSPCPTIFFKH